MNGDAEKGKATSILEGVCNGDAGAAVELLPLVYAEMPRTERMAFATIFRAGERAGIDGGLHRQPDRRFRSSSNRAVEAHG
jgi:hypothetical protein